MDTRKLAIIIIGSIILNQTIIMPFLQKNKIRKTEKRIYKLNNTFIRDFPSSIGGTKEKENISKFLKMYEETNFENKGTEIQLLILTLLEDYIKKTNSLMCEYWILLTGDWTYNNNIYELQKKNKKINIIIKNLLREENEQ